MPLVAIAGPTGAGKSELGLRIAEWLDGEIVNCDSVQIYKYFNIGTAKLPLEQRRGIPHYLLDVAEPAEVFSAGEYSRRAREILQEIRSRGKIPVVVGGTGFYLRALLDGLPPLPERDPLLRSRLQKREERRPYILHKILQRLDGEAASHIYKEDLPKVIRAMEVRLLTGLPQNQQPSAIPLEGFRVLKLGLFPPRAALYAKLNQRTEWMFRHGLVAEVEQLLASGVSPTAKPFESLGYRQALSLLCRECSLSEAITSTQTGTRQYAKRQITWFRHERDLVPLECWGDQADVHPILSKFLQG